MAQPTIAAVVVAHSLERIEQTCACIESLRANTRPPDELMVVVDQNPMLRRVLTRLVGPPVDLYDNAGDGISAARTTALRHSRSEVLAFVDDDAWVEPDFLDTLGDAFRAPGVIAAGARILPEWEEPARALPAELVWIVGGTYSGHRDDAGPISRPLGAAMAVRRDALAAVGGFHPDFGPRRHRKSSSNEELATFTLVRRHYGDDCIVYVPGAIAHHAAPAARCTDAYVLRRSFVEGTSKGTPGVCSVPPSWATTAATSLRYSSRVSRDTPGRRSGTRRGGPRPVQCVSTRPRSRQPSSATAAG